MVESARHSTTDFGMDQAEPEALAKIESLKVQGEFSPAGSLSEEKIDDGSLEKGSADKPKDDSRAPPSHRPTGFKVPQSHGRKH
jgi:hypothetical protein